MRDILFRGFHERGTGKDKIFLNGEWIQGEWVEGNLFVDEKKEKCEILVGYVNYRISWEVIPETVGQYTGLKDKNETKIFEGDIVAYGRDYGLVIYDEKCAKFSLVFEDWCTNFVEVVTNIYSNPELLEVNE